METLTEKVKRFLTLGDGSGYGSGYGYGSGDGYGSGSGDGYGSGYGSGSGSGYGYSSYIINFDGSPVYQVDDEPTLIYRVHSNVAHGAILNGDLTLTDCVIVRDDRHFAHGETLQKATEALREKAFDDMDEDDRIDAFLEVFPDLDAPAPNRELYDWHHRLTGSCELGRDMFVRDRGIDLDGETSVRDFLRLVRNSYGGEIIQAVEKRYGG